MKLGPGIDLSLAMHHVGEGLFFQRQPDGAVRVLTTNGEHPLATGQNVKTDHTIEHQSWCSAVAASSARGDTLEGITAVEECLRAEPQQPRGPSDQ